MATIYVHPVLPLIHPRTGGRRSMYSCMCIKVIFEPNILVWFCMPQNSSALPPYVAWIRPWGGLVTGSITVYLFIGIHAYIDPMHSRQKLEFQWWD